MTDVRRKRFAGDDVFTVDIDITGTLNCRIVYYVTCLTSQTADLASATAPVLHHVAYVVEDLDQVVADYKNRGYRFDTEEPFTNFMGYRLIYLDTAHTHGTRIHFTDSATLQSDW